MNKPELVIEVTRGGYVESRHQVIAVICDAKGKRHSQWGNVDQQVFPRSSNKPLQALPLMISGAAHCNPPEKQRRSKVVNSRQIYARYLPGNITIYRQPDIGDHQAS
jgi:L-asparaginase II